MAAPPKKKSLDMLLAMSGGPKSQNPEGVTGTSIGAPDQGGDALAAPMDEMLMEEEVVAPAAPADHENCIVLPPGFQAPEGSEDGTAFTTTVHGSIRDGKFYVESLGDMPVAGGGGGATGYEQQKADEKAAQAVFQPGR
jgi:hypothetical protein